MPYFQMGKDFLSLNLQLSHNISPIFYFLAFGFLLFSISFASVVYNYQNYLLVLIGMELILLSLSLLFIFASLGFFTVHGFIYCLVLLALAGIESAIGLCLVINIFFLLKNIDIDDFLYLKG